MFTKIKEFLFGKDPVQSPVATPYKIETPAEVGKPADDRVEAPAPVAEAVTQAPVAKAPAKKQQFEKKTTTPKAPAKPKATSTPRPPRKPAVK